MIYIVGSGPAGVACAHALVQACANLVERLISGFYFLQIEPAEVPARSGALRTGANVSGIRLLLVVEESLAYL